MSKLAGANGPGDSAPDPVRAGCRELGSMRRKRPKPRQGRKAATVWTNFRVPWMTWLAATGSGGARGGLLEDTNGI